MSIAVSEVGKKFQNLAPPQPLQPAVSAKTSLEPMPPVEIRPEDVRFRGALERGDFRGAMSIYNAADDGLKESCGKHMAALSDDTLITMFKEGGIDTSHWILR